MRKIIALWLDDKKTTSELEQKSLQTLAAKFVWIGFIATEEEELKYQKYTIVSGGQVCLYAISCNRSFNPENVKGEYFVFDTKNELLEWMKD